MLFLLGLLDLLAAVLLIISSFNIALSFAVVVGVLLILKSLVFFSPLPSAFDFFSGVFLVLAAFGHTFSFAFLFSLWLFQKSLLSFFTE